MITSLDFIMSGQWFAKIMAYSFWLKQAKKVSFNSNLCQFCLISQPSSNMHVYALSTNLIQSLFYFSVKFFLPHFVWSLTVSVIYIFLGKIMSKNSLLLYFYFTSKIYKNTLATFLEVVLFEIICRDFSKTVHNLVRIYPCPQYHLILLK